MVPPSKEHYRPVIGVKAVATSIPGCATRVRSKDAMRPRASPEYLGKLVSGRTLCGLMRGRGQTRFDPAHWERPIGSL